MAAPHVYPTATQFTLKNRYELERTSPSLLEGKIEPAEEKRLRRKFASFIQQAGLLLELPNSTISTAVVFFQRYFAVVSFAKEDPYVRADLC